jgi:hypothetical protein
VRCYEGCEARHEELDTARRRMKYRLEGIIREANEKG